MRKVSAGAVVMVLGLCRLASAGPAGLPVSEVAPGIFVHLGAMELMNRDNEGAIANIGFIVGNDGVAVIDTGGSAAEGEQLLAAIKRRTDKPVRYVINTHAHPDHVFGNSAFLGTGVEFVGSSRMPGALATRGPHYLEGFRHSMGDELINAIRLVPATRLVETRLELDLGSRTLLLQAWPTAHSDNDLTVLDERSGTLFAGDLDFVGHIPVVDGSLLGWLRVIEQLRDIPARRVVPGHGAVSEWPAALADEQRYLQKLLADVRSLVAKGTPIGTAAATAAASERPHWRLFDEYNARNATAAYSEVEWE